MVSDVLAHDDRGDGPAVLLLHAGVADRRMWGGQLDVLAGAGYRAIAPDMPGFGEASSVPAGLAPWAAVIELLDALGVDRAVVVGDSFGAAVALRVAALAAGRVSGLVLVSAPPLEFAPSPQLAAAWQAEESALEAGDVEEAVRAVVDAWTLPDAPRDVRELVATMQRRAFALQADAPDLADLPDPVERDPSTLDRVSAPALIAVGEHDMPDFQDAARDLADRLPDATPPVLIPEAGHLAPLERPAAFNALVLTFLQQQAAP